MLFYSCAVILQRQGNLWTLTQATFTNKWHTINSESKNAAWTEMRKGVLPPHGSARGYSGRVEWLETQINRAKCQSTQYCFVTQVINSNIIPSPFKHPALITWQILQEWFTSREKCEQINKAEEGWSHGKGEGPKHTCHLPQWVQYHQLTSSNLPSLH